ncbi:MAG: hypothetical protein MR922_14050, partial [Lachnospiraceae bacterium]|nr:hypothetical protein [Lachnospiraceae bacterium]
LLNNDIVNIDEKSLMDITTSIRKEIKHDIDVLTNELASFCRIENDIIEVASKVDDYYWGCIAEKKSVEPSFAILDAWVNMALKGIESGCFEESQLYINKLNLYNYPLTFGLRIYKDFKMNGTINHDNIIMLKSYAGNEQLYYRLLMRMSEPLDLSKKELLELAETIIYPTSGKGCYYKALAVQKSSPKFSEYLMKKSSDLGFQLAKNYILRQAIASNDLNAIESMGNELLPLANYTLAMKVMDKQYAKAVTRLKMAAACEYFPAIKELVRINYQRMIKSNNKKIIAEKLVRVILYVLDKENNAEYCEWAGNLYDVLGDGKRAVEYLKKSETNQSYYKLGTWYKNGINVSRDYNKSLQYYKKASELGHPNADHQVKKVQSIIKQEKQARIVREKQDYATISDEKEQRRKVRRHDDDFCFITSATCQY